MRRLFRDQEGVMVFSKPTRRVGGRKVRGYQSLTIPRSVTVRVWERLSTGRGSGISPSLLAFDEHLTPQEIAKAWGRSDETIRRIFRDEPGVLLFGQPSRRVGRRLIGGYRTMRVPRSIRDRVHQRLSSRHH